MNKINYQKELDKILNELNGVPKLLLHSCCAPCSSYCIEYLSKYFEITVFYYNPNLDSEEEYYKRASEQKRLISEMTTDHPVSFVLSSYDSMVYKERIKGLENDKEGGKRCTACFNLRLEKAAQYAKDNDFDYFTTTLTISPLKDAYRLNNIGAALEQRYDVFWLPSDFKKNEGYKRSLELSREHNLYRQDYCGCVYSKNERTSFTK